MGVGGSSALSVQPARAASAAGEAARAAELDVIYATAPVGLCFLDNDLRFVRVNAAMAAINGREAEAHLGLTVREVLGPLADQLEPLYRMVLEAGEPIAALELKAAPRPERLQDGPAHWILHVHPVRDGAGEMLGLNVSVSDVTESRRHEDHRRRLYQELLESEQRLRALSDNLPYGMVYQIAVSPDGASRRFSYVAANCQRLNGVPAERAMADPDALYGLIPPDHLERLVALEDEALRALKPFDAEVPFRQPDGSLRWFRISSAPRAAPDGSTIWDGIQIDIHEAREAQERLKADENRLNLTLQAAPIGFWEYNLRTNVLNWDERLRSFYGYSADAELRLEDYHSRLHPEDYEAVRAGYEAALRPGGGDFSFEHRTLLPDGSGRWIQAYGRVVPDAKGDPERVVGASVDVTERKLAEEHRKLLLKELNHRVANSFQLAVSLLQLHANRAADAGVKDQLETVQHRLVAIAAAHANLYDDGELRSLDAGRYIEELCRRLREGWTADGSVTLDVSAEPCELATERAIPLGLILNELVTNAAKYAFEGRERGRIAVRFGRTAGGCRLSVADDGKGLPETGPERHGGLGMGLVKALVRQVGGSLAIDNQAGARFVIDLPD